MMPRQPGFTMAVPLIAPELVTACELCTVISDSETRPPELPVWIIGKASAESSFIACPASVPRPTVICGPRAPVVITSRSCHYWLALDCHDVYPPDRLAHPGRVRHMLAYELILEPRLDAVPRRAHLGQVVGLNRPELHDLPRPDELLAPFERRLALYVSAELARRPQRPLHLSQRGDELLHGRGVEGEGVVGALPRPVVRVVVLEDACAKHERGEAWDRRGVMSREG